MAQFWRIARIWWDRSRSLSWGLPLSGVCGVLITMLWPQSPGVSIGLLALAAGVMSVRPKMPFREKLIWVLVLIAFTVLEVRSIKRNDQEAREYRDSQNRAFNEIANDLKASIASSAGQYRSTIEHVDGVLTQTETIDALARTSLENITGGDSYIAMIPDVAYSGDEITFSVINRGKSMLAGATVLITSQGVFWPGVRPLLMDAVSKRLELPTMHPGERMVIDRRVSLPAGRPDGDLERIYITIEGPNFSTEEFLTFRKTGHDSSGRDAWDYEYNIIRQLPFHLYKPSRKVLKDPILERATWTTQWDPMFPIGEGGKALPIDPKSFWSKAASR
jgi:hypothetical protein